MKVAFNYEQGGIIQDAKGDKKIYTGEEMRIIGKAYYKWVQKKQPLIYEEKTSIEN